MSETPVILSRRHVLAGAGALIVSFGVARAQEPASPSPPLPGNLKEAPLLDRWIRIDAHGGITVFTGKAELGQGIKTALLQVAAEQLDVPLQTLKLQTADTSLTANEGFTAGSHSMQDSGTAILHAAAQTRAILVAEASRQLSVPEDQLSTRDGIVAAPDGRKLSYGEIVSEQFLHVQAQPTSSLKEPGRFTVMNTPVRRVDIPAKVTGGAAYVQDMRPAGMVHARVVRAPSYGAKLVSVDTAKIEAAPGVLNVMRDGNFLAVVAKSEYQAVKAMRLLAAAARWNETAKLPNLTDLPHHHLAPVAGFRDLQARSAQARQRTQHFGEIYQALSIARLDRALLRGRRSPRRPRNRLDPYPGRLPRPRRHRRDVAPAQGTTFAASMSKARVAMGIMERTTRPPMLRWSRGPIRMCRFAFSGCESRSTAASPTALRW
jgi:hypothetical protein